MDDEERFVTEEQFNNDRRFRLLQLRDQGVSHSNIAELNIFHGNSCQGGISALPFLHFGNSKEEEWEVIVAIRPVVLHLSPHALCNALDLCMS